ncbi:Beta-galactosidase 15 [Vitis vinifera]|uniref:Beta-galactosidase n=1 Tax=Vitis vinifera TaxID=29760 RepID=A0A438E8L2_VITVI|nr:Beta-galactosidase 15 [Vitis vinifera]
MYRTYFLGNTSTASSKNATRAISFCVLFVLLSVLASAVEVSHDGRALIIDGKHRILQSGSIHYPRSTPRKAKAGGLDAIETYVFWNVHEPLRRQYDFSGNLDLIRFIQTIQAEGLYAVLRIGPYVCAEWTYGGFPMWLHNMPGIEFRTANKVFMNEMQNFTTLIVDMVKQEKLFASQGGPIIIAQIENEYGNIMAPYGDAGKVYVDWCAAMANSLDIGVPWIMCQQSDAPQPMINTCNGWYCDSFTPNNPNSPKMWTENWTGWFKNWGGKDPHRTAEDLSYSVARFFQTGGTFQNYYMYHGGTNFGRVAGGPYITTSYDYDAPLDEFGNLNQPKWGHLKDLHTVLKSMEETLTEGNITTTDMGNSVEVTVYATQKVSSCFFGNSNTTNDATFTYGGTEYTVPAWSVSILPDCKKEVYNTAKVNAQTSVMVKNKNEAEDQPASLKWSWRPEMIDDTAVLGKGQVSANRIIDQKTTNDRSDYLWYMNSVDLNEDDLVWTDNMTLRVNATGHILHAYVNGEYLGSQWATNGIFNYVFEEKVKLKPGKNLIALLSATIGFQNYGAFYDLVQSGISGPWRSLEERLYDPESPSKWEEGNVPLNRNLTWYKFFFLSSADHLQGSSGTDAVVVDLQGLGKGEAWVNGQSLGRYWPSSIAEDGCNATCDYRGPYTNTKCVRNCGNPTQRWYHVPRSFLTADENTLVLFEEFGGNPSLVNFQTVTIGTACGNAYENNVLELACQNRPISDIKFASFGDPQGSCGSFSKGSCEGNKDALDIIKKACVGKESCSLDVSEKAFGSTSCGSIPKRLAVEAVC